MLVMIHLINQDLTPKAHNLFEADVFLLKNWLRDFPKTIKNDCLSHTIFYDFRDLLSLLPDQFSDLLKLCQHLPRASRRFQLCAERPWSS